jgi:uncharacterized protein (UPF0218 family)
MFSLPEENRVYFQKPFGKIYSNFDEILPLIMGKRVYTVGDVVTYSMLKRGLIPDIAIVDHLTKREPCSINPDFGDLKVIKADNPPGTITDDLLDAIEQALGNVPAVIDVNGEEDLAVIPVIMMAPLGSVILYGQPGKGVVLRDVTEESKKKGRKLFDLFVKIEN